ncbi:MAG: nucleotidyltransferase domain-containing protein [Desulfuromonadales bacterium]
MSGCFENSELKSLIKTLRELQSSGDIKLALLYGSFANGAQHCRSDIDLALSLSSDTCDREISIIDQILMSAERQVSILRLDDPDESPFVVQASLKGIHLVDPDLASYYKIADWALHESESIRARRQNNYAD